MTVPSGRAVTADFRCSTFVDRDADNVRADRRQNVAQLTNTVGVGAAAVADVDRVADLEHVAAVEGAGWADAIDRIPERLDDLLGLDDLGLAAIGAGPEITATFL